MEERVCFFGILVAVFEQIMGFGEEMFSYSALREEIERVLQVSVSGQLMVLPEDRVKFSQLLDDVKASENQSKETSEDKSDNKLAKEMPDNLYSLALIIYSRLKVPDIYNGLDRYLTNNKKNCFRDIEEYFPWINRRDFLQIYHSPQDRAGVSASRYIGYIYKELAVNRELFPYAVSLKQIIGSKLERGVEIIHTAAQVLRESPASFADFLCHIKQHPDHAEIYANYYIKLLEAAFIPADIKEFAKQNFILVRDIYCFCNQLHNDNMLDRELSAIRRFLRANPNALLEQYGFEKEQDEIKENVYSISISIDNDDIDSDIESDSDDDNKENNQPLVQVSLQSPHAFWNPQVVRAISNIIAPVSIATLIRNRT